MDIEYSNREKEASLMMHGGANVDVSLIAAPKSTKPGM